MFITIMLDIPGCLGMNDYAVSASSSADTFSRYLSRFCSPSNFFLDDRSNQCILQQDIRLLQNTNCFKYLYILIEVNIYIYIYI